MYVNRFTGHLFQICIMFLFLVSAVIISCSAESEDTNEDINRIDFEKYLSTYGYLELSRMPQQVRLEGSKDDKERSEAVKKAIGEFQKYAGLRATGFVDKETKDKMVQKRCGVKDFDIFGIAKDSGARDYMWKKKKVTWKLQRFSAHLDKGQQRRSISEAFKVWQNAIPVDFVEHAPGTPTDITIEFGRKDHGDSYPFDGKGAVLGHAFYPKDGRCHFDEDENWSYGDAKASKSRSTTDLTTVATHELGHILGLPHTKERKAIMAPFYKLTFDNNGKIEVKLHADDLESIQGLYDVKKSVYIFIKDRYWIKNGKQLSYGGIVAEKFAGGIREVKHAASDSYGQLFLFSEKQVWSYKYDDRKKSFYLYNGYPKKLPSETIAFNPALVFRWTDGNIIFIKDGNFQIWDYTRNAVSFSGLSSNYFPGIPGSATEGFTNINSIYFIDNNNVAQYNRRSKKLKNPVSIADFFNCYESESLRINAACRVLDYLYLYAYILIVLLLVCMSLDIFT